MNERIWNFDEAAQYLACSPRTLRKWCSRRQIPHIKMGSRLVRFSKADLDKWLTSSRVEALD